MDALKKSMILCGGFLVLIIGFVHVTSNPVLQVEDEIFTLSVGEKLELAAAMKFEAASEGKGNNFLLIHEEVEPALPIAGVRQPDVLGREAYFIQSGEIRAGVWTVERGNLTIRLMADEAVDVEVHKTVLDMMMTVALYSCVIIGLIFLWRLTSQKS